MSKKKDRDIARDMYIESNGEMPLIDIAEKLGKKPGTIRGWKSRHKWDETLLQEKGVTIQKKCNATKESCKEDAATTKHENKVIKKIAKEVAANEDLNDKQKLFCMYYLKYFNATKAYQKAYGVDYLTANAHGYKLLSNVVIKAEIERLKAERLKGIFLDGKTILQQYIDIAFADLTDYIEFGTKEEPVMGAFGPAVDEYGEVMMQTKNYVLFKESENIDGTILSSVSVGKDGAKLKLQDKMKALEWLTKNLSKYQHDIDLEEDLLLARIKKEEATAEKMLKEINSSNIEPIQIEILSKDSRGD